MYYTIGTKRKGGTNFLTLKGLLPRREGRCFACFTRREVKTVISYDSMTVMLTLGIFLVCLIRLIIEIIKNMKK